MAKRMNLVAVAVAASIAIPSAAWPCGNAVYLRGKKAVREIKRAEDQLRKGNYDGLSLYLYLHKFDDPRLQHRAEIIDATYALRRAEESTDVEHYATALQAFRALRATDADDPVVQSRLAEVLLFDPAAADETRTLIEDLVTRDVMPEPMSWSVAATVRDRAGDATGRDLALSRCKKVAGRRAKLLCKVIGGS